MSVWKFSYKQQDVSILELLKEYAKSLTEETNNILTGIIEPKLENNKLHYLFKIKNKHYTLTLFDITLIDLDNVIALNVKYMSRSEYFNLTIDKLKIKIDELISSDEMGKYLRYLLDIDERLNPIPNKQIA